MAPFLLLFLFYVWMFQRQRAAMGGGLFGRGAKPVDPETVRVTFDDVAGIDEVEAEINEVVDFLKDPGQVPPSRSARAEGRAAGRVPPGTGKTLLGTRHRRRGESSLLQRERVGVHRDDRRRRRQPGPRAASQRRARSRRRSSSSTRSTRSAGLARAAQSFGGHDEREQTLNQILTEMDGFSGHEGVVVLAATNRPDVLDPALLRPGRFDRQIMVHPPDQQGPRRHSAVHTRKVPLAPDVDLRRSSPRRRPA